MARVYPTIGQAARVWARIGLLSFGGPAGQIALMHRILVDERKWLGETRFLHALNYCMLLPGPEAMQLATYIGWLMHGTAGGILAGLLFVLPGVVAIMGLSLLYVGYGAVGWVAALFYGLKAAVLAIVVQALLRIAQRALGDRLRRGIALAAFVAIWGFGLAFPLVVLGAGLAGFVAARLGWRQGAAGGHGPMGHTRDADTLLGEETPDHVRTGWGHVARVLALWGPIWLGPVAAIFALLGPADVFAQIAGFFSVLAVVTFGGAYAVLAYVAQEAVQNYGWLSAGQMLDGLGLAETTPGPLIMVTQFVGFLAAAQAQGSLWAGVWGGLLTTWVTFAPCFLWIFLGAPYIERLRGNAALSAALGAITAAVVGVIANLALWFGLHVLFAQLRPVPGLAVDWPVWSSLDPVAAGLVLGALILMLGRRMGAVPVLGLAALAGVGLHLAGLI